MEENRKFLRSYMSMLNWHLFKNLIINMVLLTVFYLVALTTCKQTVQKKKMLQKQEKEELRTS